MGQFEDLKLFSIIVDQGSISKAAAKVNIAKSAVSRRLGLLEQKYGTRLINREPGQWEITATGRELYQRASEVLIHADEIERDFTETNQSLDGSLVVSVPREFGLSFLSPALMGFKERHPEIQLMVDFDDRKVDLSRENYDFAIRIATKLEPGVTAQHIGTSHYKVCASPTYLKENGIPNSMFDLDQHRLLQYGAARRSSWAFTNSEGEQQVYEFRPSMNSNSGLFLLDAVLNHMGIVRLPDFICHSAIETGALVPILPNITFPDLQIHLVHSEERRLNRRMRLFAQEIVSACAEISNAAQ